MPVQDGLIGTAHVGVATDGAGKVYFSVNGAGAVYRYTSADRRVVPVSTGFAFVGGHTNTLTLDGFGSWCEEFKILTFTSIRSSGASMPLTVTRTLAQSERARRQTSGGAHVTDAWGTCA